VPDAWLRLALAPGVGNTSLIRLLTAFGSPEAVLASGRSALSAHLSKAQCDALLADPDPAQLEAAHAWLGQPGNSLMTLADEDYPKACSKSPIPPPCCIARGGAA
jgi:DNA processing protein